MKISQAIKVAVDAVVFGYADSTLYCLLIQQKFGGAEKKWALPGGFVQNEEHIDQAVRRELLEETNLNVNYLEQLYTFGDVHRDQRGRIISIAYLALINPRHVQLKADTDALDAQWFPTHELPELAFDHKEIISVGQTRLRNKISYEPIGFELLSEEFPFSDIENIYQTILQKTIDRRNFRKKLLSFGFLTKTSKTQKISSGRPAALYKFNQEAYHKLKEKGFYFEIKFA